MWLDYISCMFMLGAESNRPGSSDPLLSLPAYLQFDPSQEPQQPHPVGGPVRRHSAPKVAFSTTTCFVNRLCLMFDVGPIFCQQDCEAILLGTSVQYDKNRHPVELSGQCIHGSPRVQHVLDWSYSVLLPAGLCFIFLS